MLTHSIDSLIYVTIIEYLSKLVSFWKIIFLLAFNIIGNTQQLCAFILNTSNKLDLKMGAKMSDRRMPILKKEKLPESVEAISDEKFSAMLKNGSISLKNKMLDKNYNPVTEQFTELE